MFKSFDGIFGVRKKVNRENNRARYKNKENFEINNQRYCQHER
jgi:hypothetical protein